MANRTPKTQDKTRRRLCLAEQTHDQTPYLCTRDLDHPGDHTWIPREDMPAKLREALLDGGGVDADDVTTELRDDLPADPPAPGEDQDREWFNGDNKPADTVTVNTEQARELLKAEAAEQELAEARVAALKAEAADIEKRRPDAIARDGPRPVSVSGAPGSRLADVTSLVSTWTQLGIPVELQDEMTQIQIAKLALDSMLEEIIRTRRPSDPALITSLRDAVDHIARARGLVRGTGAGS